MSEISPNKIGFEVQYIDSSGVEYAVRYDGNKISGDGDAVIEIEHVSIAEFPLNKLDWLIACLSKIKLETTAR